MIESMDDIDLTDEYWDCECEKEYTHLRSQEFCPICRAEQDEQPNSRVSEVLRYGFVIVEPENEIVKAKKLAIEWMKNNVDLDQWPEDEWTSLTDEFDLNIYVDDDENKRATVFTIVDGETDLERSIEVF